MFVVHEENCTLSKQPDALTDVVNAKHSLSNIVNCDMILIYKNT